MSDFIARIAARAVGEAPAAHPRLPSAFEDAGRHGEAGLEVVEAEVPAERPPSPAHAPRATAAGDAPAPPPAEDPGVAPREPGRREPAAPATHEPVTPGRPERVPAAARRPEPEPPPTETAGAVAAAPEPVPATPDPAPAAVPAAAAAVPRIAHATAPARAEATVAPVEPPPVRIHIARLEVRANLQHPPPSKQRTRDDEQPPELSLADYLRGRRVGA